MLRKIQLGLLAAALCFSTVVATGCGGSSGPVAPEKFAPPPTEKDEVSSDKARPLECCGAATAFVPLTHLPGALHLKTSRVDRWFLR